MSLINQLLGNRPFLVHLIVYVGVNVLLFVIDMLTSPQTTWFQWPLLGWGIGLLGHGIQVYMTQRSRTA
ncbi:MAG: 2TM domain-containing protein [Pseudomonadota bacterium]